MRNFLIAILLLVIGLIVPCICIVKSIHFDQKCGGYLKQTADANTPELALERINKAISYIEENGLTTGYTSVFWKTEDENVEYWYKNIKACQKELSECMSSTQLEKTNVLMKVRETLTDDSEKGTKLTIPKGISRYPHNFVYGILLTLSLITIGIVLLIAYIETID